ncbi:arsenosugar biosynthesis radical SAM (seleno)protein ArsS [Pseudomonadota bacterium]
MHATLPLLEKTDFPAIQRGKLKTLQVNMGYRCNQQCLHCHVNASPKRSENMNGETVDQLIRFLRAGSVKTLDLTGGAPEMNPGFKRLIRAARELDINVIDRCNLTILLEEGYDDLAQFLADNKVTVVASLPCYIKDNVDQQRGKGTFDDSLKGLKKLNHLGYGKEGSRLVLDLMYNPQGASLPPSQSELETAYREHLKNEFDIEFNNLFTLTNMPVQRFGSTLISKGEFENYMQLLRDNFNQENLESVMCRSLINVDWQGYLYDCDFNQMLKLPAPVSNKPQTHIKDFIDVDVEGNNIVIKDHCYGCTAGQGSSCSGAL